MHRRFETIGNESRDTARVTAFLPCRKGSERVPRKNIRRFGSFTHGLVEIKLGQLLACVGIDHVVLSTNDEEVIEFAECLDMPRLIIHRRADNLSSSATSTGELVSHARELVESGHILWTHVTSPFITSALYDELIAAYRHALTQGYDSLMTTTLLQTFLWTESGPLTYDRSIEKWPRTQTLTPVHEVNSAAFLAPVEVYGREHDRIGAKPKLHPLDRLTALDIDWEEDFVLAEQLLMTELVTV